MPLFEFTCETHGAFEKLVKTQAKWTICPECGARCYKEDFSLPAKFMGCFGENNATPPAPSKRHSTKLMDKKGN